MLEYVNSTIIYYNNNIVRLIFQMTQIGNI